MQFHCLLAQRPLRRDAQSNSRVNHRFITVSAGGILVPGVRTAPLLHQVLSTDTLLGMFSIVLLMLSVFVPDTVLLNAVHCFVAAR